MRPDSGGDRCRCRSGMPDARGDGLVESLLKSRLADRNVYKSLLDNSTQSLTDAEKSELAKVLELEFPEIMHLLELPIAVIWG